MMIPPVVSVKPSENPIKQEAGNEVRKLKPGLSVKLDNQNQGRSGAD